MPVRAREVQKVDFVEHPNYETKLDQNLLRVVISRAPFLKRKHDLNRKKMKALKFRKITPFQTQGKNDLFFSKNFKKSYSDDP